MPTCRPKVVSVTFSFFSNMNNCPSMLFNTLKMCQFFSLITCLTRIRFQKKHINILRKTIEGYQNSFDFITFGNIIFKQIIFVIDRIITMQFTKMQIEIHGSLVTIQYYTKCTDPVYPKFTSKKFSALNFC